MRSVLDQDYPSIEYIVVDGSSTDGSIDLIKSFADRLAWWVSEKDRGQGEAINKGFSHAHGKILAWLNSDDYYLPNAISSVVKIFDQNPDVVLVYGDMLAVDTHGETTNVLKYKQYSLEDLLCFQIIGQPAVFFRREAFEKAGGLDINYHYMLDHHLWIRIAQQGKILHVPETWAAARYHPQAKNRLKPLDFGREAFRILEWMERQPGLSRVLAGVEKRAMASANRVNARYFLDAGQPASSLRYWFRAFSLHPPTAVQRSNIFVSAVLQLLGFNQLREMILRSRRRAYSTKKQKP
jgi:GT2 family glycosyltransferase